MEITEVKDINKTADSFGKAAKIYHQEARIQQKAAEGLLSSLLPWKGILPDGPLLEIGCGTGFLTRLLLQNFPGRECIITDASAEMLAFCKKEMNHLGLVSERVSFEVLDANNYAPDKENYALVISNFAVQWFKDASIVLENLSKSLYPGGLLLCSFPGNHSFEKWYEYCIELGLPYTANPLPDVEELVIKLSMGPIQIDYYENDLFEEFDTSLDFFRHLKNIGASRSVLGKSLSHKQFKLLINHWDKNVADKLKVKWHMVYLAAKKDG